MWQDGRPTEEVHAGFYNREQDVHAKMPPTRLNIVHRPAIGPSRMMVACLCAAWCGTCRGYEDLLRAEAQRFPDTTFVWLDVEGDSELVGDLDIETFPTLLVTAGSQVLFYGPVLPGIGALDRLVRALHEHGAQPVPVDTDVRLLAQQLNSLIGVQES